MAMEIIEIVQFIIVVIHASLLWFDRKSTRFSIASVLLSLNVIVLALASYTLFVFESNDVLQMTIFTLELIMLPVSWRSLKIAEWLEEN